MFRLCELPRHDLNTGSIIEKKKKKNTSKKVATTKQLPTNLSTRESTRFDHHLTKGAKFKREASNWKKGGRLEETSISTKTKQDEKKKSSLRRNMLFRFPAMSCPRYVS